MKRIFCLMLILLLVCGICGCHYSDSGDILEPVEFYYPRNSAAFVYGSEDGVIAAEIREGSGHTSDLNYLLSMYLRGPMDAGMYSPFPENCRLLTSYFEGDTVYVRLSSTFSTLENMELTIASTALAKTCLSIVDATYVHIDSVAEGKSISITLDADSIHFADYSVVEPTEITE